MYVTGDIGLDKIDFRFYILVGREVKFMSNWISFYMDNFE